MGDIFPSLSSIPSRRADPIASGGGGSSTAADKSDYAVNLELRPLLSDEEYTGVMAASYCIMTAVHKWLR